MANDSVEQQVNGVIFEVEDDQFQKLALRYLQICLDGAASFGSDFYQQFINTTYIGNRKLSEISQLTL